jgi:WD40 repeat protein
MAERPVAEGCHRGVELGADPGHPALADPGLDARRRDDDPRWSPDGQWLLFSTYAEAPGSASGPWIIPTDGGGPRHLGEYGGWAW